MAPSESRFKSQRADNRTLGDEAIESFCQRTARAWRLGRKGIDDGIVVCLAMKGKRVRIELGIGMNRPRFVVAKGQVSSNV